MVYLVGEKVLLRDIVKEDIEDRIRWETKEVEWQEWDAPWENDQCSFCEEKYKQSLLKKIEATEQVDHFRYGFEICENSKEKKHIGWVNAYYIDENYAYTKEKKNIAIGINIPEISSRRKGYATEAWILFINYILDNGVEDIYTQTWSGNSRVIGLMGKIGFLECRRLKGVREVRGERFDALTFKLDIKIFRNIAANID